MEDVKIIELYFERDESAISATDEKYGKYLLKIAYNILTDKESSKECLDDTYIKTWQVIPPTVPNILSAFLAKITRNIALDRWRLSHAKKRENTVALSLDELSECVGEENLLSSIELSELSELISEFLRGEEERARKIFIRRYFYGDSVSEIAKFLKITKTNAKTTLYRTRKRLNLYLKERMVTL